MGHPTIYFEETEISKAQGFHEFGELRTNLGDVATDWRALGEEFAKHQDEVQKLHWQLDAAQEAAAAAEQKAERIRLRKERAAEAKRAAAAHRAVLPSSAGARRDQGKSG